MPRPGVGLGFTMLGSLQELGDKAEIVDAGRHVKWDGLQRLPKSLLSSVPPSILES